MELTKEEVIRAIMEGGDFDDVLVEFSAGWWYIGVRLGDVTRSCSITNYTGNPVGREYFVHTGKRLGEDMRERREKVNQ
jgi:hypothetical protein